MELVLTPPAEHLDLEGLTFDEHPDNGSRNFSDGEVYVQLPEAKDINRAMVVHSGAPNPNRGLEYLRGALEILRQNDVSTQLFLTYFPYGRQDHNFFPGGLNKAKALLREFRQLYDIEKVYGLDLHFSMREWAKQYTGFLENLHAFPLIEEKVDMKDYKVVLPDRGAIERFGVGEGFKKERMSEKDVEIRGNVEGVEGENVLVFDDLTATGTTLCKTFDRLEDMGAERIEAAVVHGVLEEGIKNARKTFDRLYVSNSIENSVSNIEIERLIREKVST